MNTNTSEQSKSHCRLKVTEQLTKAASIKFTVCLATSQSHMPFDADTIAQIASFIERMVEKETVEMWYPLRGSDAMGDLTFDDASNARDL
ncbi:unnamed protein product [Protopolystoma xenopodis]|uniref:Uncharacterized protein n=1 Tax=Protopolystoma xenopodis TaxID=117903 RepID=A0A3S5AZ32_9PLAT|nr:unnamed protein product [Protopolystoma xenopodis]